MTASPWVRPAKGWLPSIQRLIGQAPQLQQGQIKGKSVSLSTKDLMPIRIAGVPLPALVSVRLQFVTRSWRARQRQPIFRLWLKPH